MTSVRHIPLVAVFANHGDDLDLLTTTLPILGYRVLPVPPTVPVTVEAVSAFMAGREVDLVVWDISPVLSSDCGAFLDVFHSAVFEGSSVLLTTTSAAGLRASIGAYCPLALVVDWPASLTAVATAVEALCLARRDSAPVAH